MIGATVNGSNDVLAYASKFESGQSGIVVVNKGTSEQTVNVNIAHFGFGDHYFVYTLTGGTDNGEFSRKVFVNGMGPTLASGGPDVLNVPARKMSIGDGVKITAPARSVSYILVDNGDNVITGVEESSSSALMVYPNPSRGNFKVILPSTGFSRLTITDLNGKAISDIVIERDQTSVDIDVKAQRGIFFLRAEKGGTVMVKKVVLK